MNDDQFPLIAATLLLTRNNIVAAATPTAAPVAPTADTTQLTATVQTQAATISSLLQAQATTLSDLQQEVRALRSETSEQYRVMNQKLDKIMQKLFGAETVYDPSQPNGPIEDTQNSPSISIDDKTLARTLAPETVDTVPMKQTIEGIGETVQPIPLINAAVSALSEVVQINNTKLDQIVAVRTTFSTAQLKQIQQVVEAALTKR